jgi:hypothetical protein
MSRTHGIAARQVVILLAHMQPRFGMIEVAILRKPGQPAKDRAAKAEGSRDDEDPFACNRTGPNKSHRSF